MSGRPIHPLQGIFAYWEEYGMTELPGQVKVCVRCSKFELSTVNKSSGFGMRVSHSGPLWREGRCGRGIEWHMTKAKGYPSITEGRSSLTKTKYKSLLLDCIIFADKSPYFSCVFINPFPFFIYLLIRFWN